MVKRKKGKGTQPYKGKGEGVVNEEIRADEKAKYEDHMSILFGIDTDISNTHERTAEADLLIECLPSESSEYSNSD